MNYLILVYLVWFLLCVEVNSYCGLEHNNENEVTVGIHRIENYPWMGILYYPTAHKRRYTTAVVLISREIVLAAANEIDSLPKINFRSRSRVILGQNCSGTRFKVRDYVYHPDYKKSFSALALVQIITELYTGDLRPICPPPVELVNPSIYTMALSDDCVNLSVSIYEMKDVPIQDCKAFYRKAGLGVNTMWPMSPVCAKSNTGGHCVWRSGSILTVKIRGTWRLLGFHVYGPGCESPARYIDYGMYHKWVKKSIERIGDPSVSTISPNVVVMRRSTSNIQRLGPCDAEETRIRMYDDNNTIATEYNVPGKAKYNITLYSQVDYYCILFMAVYADNAKTLDRPRVRVRHWGKTDAACSPGVLIQIDLYVEIIFYRQISFAVQVFGKFTNYIDPKKVTFYLNNKYGTRPDNRTAENSTWWFSTIDYENEAAWWPRVPIVG